MTRALGVAGWALVVGALVAGWAYVLICVLRLGLVPALLLGGAGGAAIGYPAGRALFRIVHRIKPLFLKGNHRENAG